MICPNCCKVIENHSRFCGICGFNVGEYFEKPKEELLSNAFANLSQNNSIKAQAVASRLYDQDASDPSVNLLMLLLDMHLSEKEQLADLSIDFRTNQHYVSIIKHGDDETKATIEAYATRAVNNKIAKEKKEKYNTAIGLFQKQQYESAYRIFVNLGEYENAKEYSASCSRQIELENRRRIEQEKQQAEREKKRNRTQKIATSIGLSILFLIIAISIVYNSVIKPSIGYHEAIALYESGQIVSAADQMVILNGYKDSKERAAEYYSEAEKYIEAAEIYQLLGDNKKYNASIYQNAIKLFESKNAEDAKYFFNQLPKNYRDVNQYLKKCDYLPLLTLSVGDLFSFGHYEQDADSSTTNESISWIIVEKTIVENRTYRVKLLSEKTLDCQKFYTNDGDEYTPWSKTFIRNWLNTIFYDAAFSEDEKQLISETVISTKMGRQSDVSNDNVFLISDDEYSKYDGNSSIPNIRSSIATEYAEAQDDKTDSMYYGYAAYYTRTQIEYTGVLLGNVGYNPGTVERSGLYHLHRGHYTMGIKPCIWLDFSFVFDESTG